MAVPFTYQPAKKPAAPAAVPNDTKAAQATFPATGDEGVLGVVGKTLGNIPASAFDFGKNTIEFFNPLNTLKTAQDIGTTIGDALNEGQSGKELAINTAKAVPETTYQMLVPTFIQHLFKGDLKGAAATIENDPVGQIAPLILVARGAATAAGKGAEFDQAMSTLAKPATIPAKAVARGTGTAVAQTLGAGTGVGGSAIQETFGAAKTGADALADLTKAMRGKMQPEDIVRNAQDVFQAVKTQRGNSYKAQLAKIGENTASHDISPIVAEVEKQLANFNIKVKDDGELDFSRSSIANNGSARSDVQGVFDTLKTWGTQTGDRTGIGLDTLKKQLGDFYSPSSQARAFVQAVKGKVSDVLNKNVPGYKDMTAGYEKVSQLLDDIKSATGAGSTQKADTVFTKLTSAMRGDKQFRLEILREMENVDPTLMDKIAGANLNSWVPRGLVGRGTDVGAAVSILMNGLNPHLIPLMLSTSPRIVGEFVRASGMGAAKASQIIGAINKLAPLIPKASPAATLQSNQSQAQTQ